MHRFQMVPTAKLLLMPAVTNNLNHGSMNILNLVKPTCALVCTIRNLHSKRSSFALVRKDLNIFGSLMQRMRGKFNIFNRMKYRSQVLGVLLYEEIADTLDYNKFYKVFKMPDTFYSWFLVTELHVWMLLVRFMSEGTNGEEVRNLLVKTMWNDVNKRSKQLDTPNRPVNNKALTKQVNELGEQFRAALISYDEGITGDDKILAAAIWRRFLQSECNDPELVEKLVFYVRKQVCLLDTITWNELMTNRAVKWQGLDLIDSNTK